MTLALLILLHLVNSALLIRHCGFSTTYSREREETGMEAEPLLNKDNEGRPFYYLPETRTDFIIGISPWAIAYLIVGLLVIVCGHHHFMCKP